ncbi:MAG: antibiotic biosynthesis monooxygenase family protein [Pseudomonadota bacterium]
MPSQQTKSGTILRIFQVEAKPGCGAELIQKFATTSAEVVRGEPGNAGYFYGQGVEADGDYVVFTSVWEDLDAVKARFGDDWQVSFLPPGYEVLIESCSVRHIDVGSGWRVDLDG